MKPTKIENANALELMLERVETAIKEANESRKCNNEIILFVENASGYDTDFIQEDCAMLHFTPQQARSLAWKLLKLAKQNRNLHLDETAGRS